ncbi:centrosomal protein 39 kDa [Tieghemostelium lacteum]|uniref:Centrosomal protein 39 kDa n=1 Tax=Tieghemostelium lacteum TaxID=361077 RepID=A0A151ZIU6_TIELA|nr:centrosomal protein 39 kDa [Tieghemostelium lacteum]|eukprot:KYQ93876.1 centrosomal protein 39 kDa [Tieghemostelium lacteum]
MEDINENDDHQYNTTPPSGNSMRFVLRSTETSPFKKDYSSPYQQQQQQQPEQLTEIGDNNIMKYLDEKLASFYENQTTFSIDTNNYVQKPKTINQQAKPQPISFNTQQQQSQQQKSYNSTSTYVPPQPTQQYNQTPVPPYSNFIDIDQFQSSNSKENQIISNLNSIIKSIKKEIEELKSIRNWLVVNQPSGLSDDLKKLEYQINNKSNQIEKIEQTKRLILSK